MLNEYTLKFLSQKNGICIVCKATRPTCCSCSLEVLREHVSSIYDQFREYLLDEKLDLYKS